MTDIMFPYLRNVTIKSVVPDNITIVDDADAAFVETNGHQLERLYPGKWIVIYKGEMLFIEDSQDEMFRRAGALGLKFGSYSIFYPYPNEE